MNQVHSNSSNQAWHSLSTDEVAELLRVDISSGLVAEEVEDRQLQYGANAILSSELRGVWTILLQQFSDFMILVLILAALVSGIIGDPEDAIAIVVIVILNAVIGFVQDFRAEKALEALKKMAAPNATVRRDSQLQSIPATELVPGDVVLLADGNLVPADIRLTSVAQLQINESALTGESQPIDKITSVLQGDAHGVGDRFNMVYKGTIVTRGRGEGVVAAIGMQTELGKIATLISEADSNRTPLQKRLARFGKRLAILILCICAVIFVTGLIRGEETVLMFLTAVSLAVAAIPEALPAVVTISLALGARKMVQLKALVRSLPAVETLGSVTYICSDKTGTLTENSMRLELLYCDGQDHPSVIKDGSEIWQRIGNILLLNSDVQQHQDGTLTGDPTEVAMYQAALKAGYDITSALAKLPRIDEIPFDAERKRMTTIHQHGGSYESFTKGAAETIVDVCEGVLTQDGIKNINKPALQQHIQYLAENGYRVLGLAYRNWEVLPENTQTAQIESHLIFLGLVGLIDPPRAETYSAVELCKSAGITPVMITGDHPATALAVAQRLGIVQSNRQVLTGRDLDQLSDEQFAELVKNVRV